MLLEHASSLQEEGLKTKVHYEGVLHAWGLPFTLGTLDALQKTACSSHTLWFFLKNPPCDDTA